MGLPGNTCSQILQNFVDCLCRLWRHVGKWKKMILEMLSYPFLARAFVAGILVSLCAALLGVSLVLKQYSMIGDGLSHVSYGALSVALACNIAPLKLSIPIVIAAAFLLLRMTERGMVKSDAAIAAVSASALAIGITVTSLTTGMTTDVNSYMFGSILAMTQEDVFLGVVLSAAVLILFIFCYHRIFAVTFDESFGRAIGVNVSFYNSMIAILTAVTIVLGMQMMGAMLISSLVIFPALTSMRLFQSFRGVVITSGVLSVFSFTVGMMVSYQSAVPVGASIVLVNLGAFSVFFLVGKLFH